jgi:YHS domain-containing protein
MASNAPSGRSVSGKATGEIDDIMIKDPYCEVYFPKRTGVHLKHAGEDLYFCSADCRDKFLAERSEPEA